MVAPMASTPITTELRPPRPSETVDEVPPGTEIEEAIGDLIPSPNMLYAIRIEGCLAGLRVRSVARQEAYTPLVEVAKWQATFDFPETKGTLCGFWTPAFLGNVAVPGCHLHFLDTGRQRNAAVTCSRAGSPQAASP